jgi:hypothetical protein
LILEFLETPEVKQDAHEEMKQDTEPDDPEHRQIEDQDQQQHKPSLDETQQPKPTKIDETSKETRLASILKLAKDLRPLGKVVAIIASPFREAKLSVTLKIIDDEMLNVNLLHKMNKRLLSAEDHLKKNSQQKHHIIGVYAVVVGNARLPWMQISLVPKELINDIKESKDFASRVYSAKIIDWYGQDTRPTVEILKPADADAEEQEESKASK